MNKRPINCPNCSAEFSGEIKLKGRRGRAAIAEVEEKPSKSVVVANDEENTDIEARDEDLVSLEDVEALENVDDEDEDAPLDEDEDLATLEDIEEDVDIDVPVDDKKE
jgi:hypothetical protein